MPRRGFEIEVRAIGEQMHIGGAADDFSEAFAEFPIQEAHDLSYSLQREALAPKFADDGDFGKVLHRVEAAMAFAFGPDDAAFVPPLKLAGGDPGQGNHVMR